MSVPTVNSHARGVCSPRCEDSLVLSSGVWQLEATVVESDLPVWGEIRKRQTNGPEHRQYQLSERLKVEIGIR